MSVQLFATLALITSYVSQGIIVALILRCPLEVILRFEWHFAGLALVCQGLTGKKMIFILIKMFNLFFYFLLHSSCFSVSGHVHLWWNVLG